jgi:hypothetical protein
MSEVIDVWVIYDHPADFPDHFVVSRQTVNRDGTITHHPERWLRTSLEKAREVVHRNAPQADTLFADPNPIIAETWL